MQTERLFPFKFVACVIRKSANYNTDEACFCTPHEPMLKPDVQMKKGHTAALVMTDDESM